MALEMEAVAGLAVAAVAVGSACAACACAACACAAREDDANDSIGYSSRSSWRRRSCTSDTRRSNSQVRGHVLQRGSIRDVFPQASFACARNGLPMPSPSS